MVVLTREAVWPLQADYEMGERDVLGSATGNYKAGPGCYVSSESCLASNTTGTPDNLPMTVQGGMGLSFPTATFLVGTDGLPRSWSNNSCPDPRS